MDIRQRASINIKYTKIGFGLGPPRPRRPLAFVQPCPMGVTPLVTSAPRGERVPRDTTSLQKARFLYLKNLVKTFLLQRLATNGNSLCPLLFAEQLQSTVTSNRRATLVVHSSG